MKPAFTRGEGLARQDRKGVYEFHEEKAREVGMIKFDVPLEAPPGKVKVIAGLSMLSRAGRYGDSAGLALVPIGRKDEYCRVGFISGPQLSWYETRAEEGIANV